MGNALGGSAQPARKARAQRGDCRPVALERRPTDPSALTPKRLCHNAETRGSMMGGMEGRRRQPASGGSRNPVDVVRGEGGDRGE